MIPDIGTTMKRFMTFFPYLVLVSVLCVVLAANLPLGVSNDSMSSRHSPNICPPCGMTVEDDAPIVAQKNGRTYRFCTVGCREQFLAGDVAESSTSQTGHERHVDVVCRMEVNASWRIASQHAGRTYHFCNQQCKTRFDADPDHFLQTRCLVCEKALGDDRSFPATYLGHTYHLCGTEHRAEFKRDPAAFFMHTMWGIPTWLYYASIAVVLLVSFGVFEWLSHAGRSATLVEGGHAGASAGPRRSHAAPHYTRDAIAGEGERLWGDGLPTGPSAGLALPILAAPIALGSLRVAMASPRTDRLDLLSFRWFAAAMRSRIFRFSLRAVVAVLFLLIVAAGLFGNQNPALNIAPILTWTVWWGLLIVLILFAGKAWCYVCPWDALAEWTEKLAFWRKNDDGLSANLKWPRVVRNILIATILFVGLTWIELGFGVTMRPRVTAYLAIAMLLMAVVSALLFDRKSFCRYGCLVGRVSGLYALFAGVEVRARSAGACTQCRGKECVTGSKTAYGCPTFLYPGTLATNTYCIQCMECVQACPHDNLAVNLRPWGSDLVAEGKPRTDEAYLALLMLAITGFHGLTMTPAWQQLIDAIRSASGAGRILGFSVGMVFLMLGPIAVYAILVAASMLLGRGKSLRPLRYHDYFIRYAYALLPIALFYHIAHNMEHLLMEGPKVIAMASDPFGWGWNVLGTAAWVIPPLISLDKLWLVQVFLVLIGHVYSLWIAQRTSLRLFGSSSAAFRSQLPMLAAMIAFSVFSLWLLKQPMEMRTSAM
jgi:YHS domain-containing protein